MPRRYKSKGGKRRNARSYKKRAGGGKLVRAVKNLQDASKCSYELTWSRINAPICDFTTDAAENASSPFVYICPIPSGSSEKENCWTDTAYKFSTATPSMGQLFTKTPLWAQQRSAELKADIRHTGSVLTYRLMGALQNVQRVFKVALISPGHAFADQLIMKRKMKLAPSYPSTAGARPGAESIFVQDYDYTMNKESDLTGAPRRVLRGWTINKRLWNVHYEQTITLGQPLYTGAPQTVAIEKLEGTGFIKIPGKGRMQRIWQTTEDHGLVPAVPDEDIDPEEPIQASEYFTQQNEKAMFLVVFGQLPSGPNAPEADPDWRPTLQFCVRDRYTARDGSIGQKPNAGVSRTPQRPSRSRKRPRYS